MEHLVVEQHDAWTRRRLMARFRDYFDNGYRDPELLYLGGRYAMSLGMNQEALRFLGPLGKMLWQADGPSPAYAPVGLLLLSILEEEQARDRARTGLEKLAETNKALADMLPRIPRGLRLAGAGDGVDLAARPALAQMVLELERLSEQARGHYVEQELDEAREVLELMLLLDGDQPDVLRNLVTVTAEQQDTEAYERYWRRYVKVLLWRMVRGDDVDAAWQDLTRFYVRVADATDSQLDRAPDDVQNLITCPGFLPRWLEAHAGLVWLESAPKTHRILQTGLNPTQLERGERGKLALMRYWFHLFYPAFSILLNLGSNVGMELVLPSAEAQLQLYFDPAERLLKRFLEWYRFGFGLKRQASKEGKEQPELVHDDHAENIVALAGCVARIPAECYTQELDKKLAEDRERDPEPKTLRQSLQNACSVPFFEFRLRKFLEDDEDGEPDWRGLVDHFGDPDTTDWLSPTIRMFLALAYCQTERPFEGLEVACRAVPEIPAGGLNPPDEPEEATQNYGLWQSVLNANISHALHAEEKPKVPPGLRVKRGASPAEAWVAVIKHEINQMEEGEHGTAVKKAAVDKIDEAYTQQVLVKGAIEKSQELVEKHDFAGARRAIRELPDKPLELKKLKANLLSQIDGVEQEYQQLDWKIDELERKLERRGVNMTRIDLLAQLNDVDKSNKPQYHALLQAIDQQL